MLKALGFEERIRGSHFIFSRDGIVEIINLQPKGPNAKPYQVKQIREIITAYGLDLESETSREDHEDEQDQTDSFD